MVSRINLEVDQSGPFFDGRARKALHAWLDDAKEDVARIGVNEVHARLGALLQHPTGAYQSTIVTERVSRFNDQVITDGDVIYGPWLEGTSSRNKTTRFKGYRIFRRARLKLRKIATPIAQAKLSRYIGRMNEG